MKNITIPITKVNLKNSLKFSLMLWFLLLSLTPLSIVSYLNYLDTVQNVENKVKSELQKLSKSEETFINNWFYYRKVDILSWSQNKSNIVFFKALKNQFKNSTKTPKDFVKSKNYTKLVSHTQDDLLSLGRDYDYIYDLFLIDSSGNILFSITKEKDLGANLLSDLYSKTKFSLAFKQTLQDGKVHYSDLEFYEPSNGIVTSFYTSAIIDEDGKIIGVMAVQLKLDRIYNLFKTDSDSLQDQKHYLVGTEGLLRTDIYSEAKAFLYRIESTWLKNDNEEIAIKYKDSFGDDVLGMHQEIDILGVKWILVNEVTLSSILSEINETAKKTFFLYLITMLIVIIVAFFIAQRLTNPLITLSEASIKFTQGRRDIAFDVSYKGEIGALATSFRNMIDSLISNEDELKVTSLKAKKSLQQLNEQKQALDAHSIVAITDIKGTITFVNKKFEDISGYSKDELVGQNHRILNSRTHDKEFWKKMYKTITSGNIWNGEVCNISKNQEYYWVDTTVVPFMDENNKPESYIAIRTDITDSKELEFELLKANEIAKYTIKAKSEFLASMSHEIRTPMNGVIGMLGLLSSSELTSTQSHQVNLAQSSANSLLTLINDILDFSKIEAGKLELDNINFNLREELGNIVETISYRAQEKNVEIILDTTEIDRTYIKSDPGRIRQILTNIVGNAIKFTSHGYVLVKASLDLKNQKDIRLILSVTDSGIGIPEEKIDTIFDSFTQVDASTTRKYGGTGLGLAIVKKLSELMDGIVKIKSKLGEGTTFIVDISVELGENSSLEMPQVHIEGKRILIVDDNEVNQEVLLTQLELWGMEVSSALDAKSALEMCKEEISKENIPPFDIAFLDMQMPEMDGAQLGVILRKDVNCNEMKLVMMTSLGAKTDVKRFAEIGFNAFFSKPATTNDIFHGLNVLVENGEAFKEAKYFVTSDYLGTLEEVDEVVWPKDTKILLVDDNKTNQLVAEGILENFELSCDIANDGQEALEMIDSATQSYSVVLMDCQMPIMDGYAASTAIREGKAGQSNISIPIIAMTANVMHGDREKCLIAGMDDYLAKPINPKRLKELLQKWILKIDSSTLFLNPQKKQKIISWDEKDALARLGGSQKVLTKIMRIFIDDIRLQVKNLKQALDKKNIEEIQRLAHSIKGSAGNISALKLQELAKSIEHGTQGKKIEELRNEYECTEKEIQIVIVIFKNYLKQIPSLGTFNQEISKPELLSSLESLRIELINGEFIQSDELDIFSSYYNESINKKLINLKKSVDNFISDEALETINDIIVEIGEMYEK